LIFTEVDDVATLEANVRDACTIAPILLFADRNSA